MTKTHWLNRLYRATNLSVFSLAFVVITLAGSRSDLYASEPSIEQTQEFLLSRNEQCGTFKKVESGKQRGNCSGHTSLETAESSFVGFDGEEIQLQVFYFNSTMVGCNREEFGGYVRENITANLGELSPNLTLHGSSLNIECTSGKCFRIVATGESWTRKESETEKTGKDLPTNSRQVNSLEFKFATEECASRNGKALSHLIKLHGGKAPVF